MAAPQASSRLEMLQARFQQKQLQEKEQKLLQLYDQQQQRAYQVVQRGSAGSNSSNQGSTVTHQTVTRTSSTSHTTSTSQGGKVRQMFDERRQTTVKGIDRSYPLEPLDNKPRKQTTNNGVVSQRGGNNLTVNRQSVTVKRVARADVNSNVNGGKPVVSYHEEVTRESFGPHVHQREHEDEEFGDDYPPYTNGNHRDDTRDEVQIEEVLDEDTIEKNRLMAKIHLMGFDESLKYRVKNDIESEQFPDDLMIDVPDKLPKRNVTKKLTQAEARLERFKNANAKKSTISKSFNPSTTIVKKRTEPILPSKSSRKRETTTLKSRHFTDGRSSGSRDTSPRSPELRDTRKISEKLEISKQRQTGYKDKRGDKYNERSTKTKYCGVDNVRSRSQSPQVSWSPDLKDTRKSFERLKESTRFDTKRYESQKDKYAHKVVPKMTDNSADGLRSRSPQFFCEESQKSATTYSLDSNFANSPTDFVKKSPEERSKSPRLFNRGSERSILSLSGDTKHDSSKPESLKSIMKKRSASPQFFCKESEKSATTYGIDSIMRDRSPEFERQTVQRRSSSPRSFFDKKDLTSVTDIYPTDKSLETDRKIDSRSTSPQFFCEESEKSATTYSIDSINRNRSPEFERQMTVKTNSSPRSLRDKTNIMTSINVHRKPSKSPDIYKKISSTKRDTSPQFFCKESEKSATTYDIDSKTKGRFPELEKQRRTPSPNYIKNIIKEQSSQGLLTTPSPSKSEQIIDSRSKSPHFLDKKLKGYESTKTEKHIPFRSIKPEKLREIRNGSPEFFCKETERSATTYSLKPRPVSPDNDLYEKGRKSPRFKIDIPEYSISKQSISKERDRSTDRESRRSSKSSETKDTLFLRPTTETRLTSTSLIRDIMKSHDKEKDIFLATPPKDSDKKSATQSKNEKNEKIDKLSRSSTPVSRSKSPGIIERFSRLSSPSQDARKKSGEKKTSIFFFQTGNKFKDKQSKEIKARHKAPDKAFLERMSKPKENSTSKKFTEISMIFNKRSTSRKKTGSRKSPNEKIGTIIQRKGSPELERSKSDGKSSRTSFSSSGRLTQSSSPDSGPKSPKSFTSTEIDTEIQEITMSDQQIEPRKTETLIDKIFTIPSSPGRTYSKMSRDQSPAFERSENENVSTYLVRKSPKKRTSLLESNIFEEKNREEKRERGELDRTSIPKISSRDTSPLSTNKSERDFPGEKRLRSIDLIRSAIKSDPKLSEQISEQNIENISTSQIIDKSSDKSRSSRFSSLESEKIDERSKSPQIFRRETWSLDRKSRSESPESRKTISQGRNTSPQFFSKETEKSATTTSSRKRNGRSTSPVEREKIIGKRSTSPRLLREETEKFASNANFDRKSSKSGSPVERQKILEKRSTSPQLFPKETEKSATAADFSRKSSRGSSPGNKEKVLEKRSTSPQFFSKESKKFAATINIDRQRSSNRSPESRKIIDKIDKSPQSSHKKFQKSVTTKNIDNMRNKNQSSKIEKKLFQEKNRKQRTPSPLLSKNIDKTTTIGRKDKTLKSESNKSSRSSSPQFSSVETKKPSTTMIIDWKSSELSMTGRDEVDVCIKKRHTMDFTEKSERFIENNEVQEFKPYVNKLSKERIELFEDRMSPKIVKLQTISEDIQARNYSPIIQEDIKKDFNVSNNLTKISDIEIIPSVDEKKHKIVKKQEAIYLPDEESMNIESRNSENIFISHQPNFQRSANLNTLISKFEKKQENSKPNISLTFNQIESSSCNFGNQSIISVKITNKNEQSLREYERTDSVESALRRFDSIGAESTYEDITAKDTKILLTENILQSDKTLKTPKKTIKDTSDKSKQLPLDKKKVLQKKSAKKIEKLRRPTQSTSLRSITARSRPGSPTSKQADSKVNSKITDHHDSRSRQRKIAEARDSIEIARNTIKSRSPICKRKLFADTIVETKIQNERSRSPSPKLHKKDQSKKYEMRSRSLELAPIKKSSPRCSSNVLIDSRLISKSTVISEKSEPSPFVKQLRSIEDIRRSIRPEGSVHMSLTRLDFTAANKIRGDSSTSKSEKQQRIAHGDPHVVRNKILSSGQSKGTASRRSRSLVSEKTIPKTVTRVLRVTKSPSPDLANGKSVDTSLRTTSRRIVPSSPSKSPDIIPKRPMNETKTQESRASKKTPHAKSTESVGNKKSTVSTAKGTDVVDGTVLENGVHLRDQTRYENDLSTTKKSDAFVIDFDDQSKENEIAHSRNFQSRKSSNEKQQASSVTARPTSSISSISSASSTQGQVSRGRMASKAKAPNAASKALSARNTIGASAADNLVSCKVCGRRFAQDRITLHEQICAKTGQKKRKQFDATMFRVKGTDLEPFVLKKGFGVNHKPQSVSKNVEIKTNWRRKHEDFINAIRSAKQMQAHLAAGGKLSDLPPPPVSDTSDYIQCPHCGRKFNQAAAERHIPKCENMLHNKPAHSRAPPKPKR